MTILSDIYKELFELNSLILQINSHMYHCDNSEKYQLLKKQKDIWLDKIYNLKSKLRTHIKDNRTNVN